MCANFLSDDMLIIKCSIILFNKYLIVKISKLDKKYKENINKI